jgi:hypothetical protein
MTQVVRDENLDQIRTSKTTTCILISTKAGATGEFRYDTIAFQVIILNTAGLNLTACNHVILVDLPWNPAVEVCPRKCSRKDR